MTAPHLILGVDPGLTGALAVVDPRPEPPVLVEVIDMPLRKASLKNHHTNAKNEIDPASLVDFIRYYSDELAGAVIEDVGAAPNQGVVSMFRFGYVTGLVTGAIEAYRVPLHKTPPAVWKMVLNLSSSKDLSRARAAKAFPDHAASFMKKCNDGRAEAALMALFGKRIFNGT